MVMVMVMMCCLSFLLINGYLLVVCHNIYDLPCSPHFYPFLSNKKKNENSTNEEKVVVSIFFSPTKKKLIEKKCGRKEEDGGDISTGSISRLLESYSGYHYHC